jgi:hypothetical protein
MWSLLSSLGYYCSGPCSNMEPSDHVRGDVRLCYHAQHDCDDIRNIEYKNSCKMQIKPRFNLGRAKIYSKNMQANE